LLLYLPDIKELISSIDQESLDIEISNSSAFLCVEKEIVASIYVEN